MLKERVGLYVDQSNINMNGGYGVDYAALRNFALRGGGQGIHLNVYSTYLPAKTERDGSWNSRFLGYQSAIRQMGYHMKMKQAQVFDDGEHTIIKANVDVDIAVDIMESASRLDRIVLVSGDGDFAALLQAARRLGARVEVLAFDHCSANLRAAADAVFPGWLIPGLLPTEGGHNRRRGIIDEVSIQGSDLGVIRYLPDDYTKSEPLTTMAPENGCYAIFHQDSILAADQTILKGAIVEFTPESNEPCGAGQDQGDCRAVDIVPLRICTRSGWYKPFKVA